MAVIEAIDSSPLCLLNEDSPTRLPRDGRPSSPDLSIASCNLSLSLQWTVVTSLNHLPIIINIDSTKEAAREGSSVCFTNFRKAKWVAFMEESEAEFSGLPAPRSCSQGFKAFHKVVHKAAKHHIPRGFRKHFRPGLSPTPNALIGERDELRSADPANPNIVSLQERIDAEINSCSRRAWDRSSLLANLAQTLPSSFPCFAR